MFTILSLGCIEQTAKNGDTVSVVYGAYHNNNTLIDDNNGEPLQFTIGNGEVVNGFNYAVIGMKVGQTKTVTVAPDEGYGLYYPSRITQESVENLEKVGINASIGSVVYATMDNNRERGVIIDNNGTNVLIDFNHPLAGKTLVFKIRLVSIDAHAGNAI
ncbi:MAG: FKBP-type peptidyl-prolyl cis-trans isomerase [Candidatus Nanoarchaeia archaeon]|nr:FKBP-type peptidyl-prolyl cis-trans isomerase [Candidatus Nanoarchaeia archaeon]